MESISSKRKRELAKRIAFAAALLAALIIFHLFFASASASASQGGLPNATYSGYVPATFSISFPQTTQINVTVRSEAAGLYSYSVLTNPPLSHVIINLSSSDIYQIYVSFQYPLNISGDTSWTLFTPGLLAGDGGSAPFTNQSSVSMVFQVELIPDQTYPTAPQIANATSGLLLNKLQASINQQTANQGSFQNLVSQELNAFAVLVTISLVAVIIFGLMVRRWTKEE